MDPTRREVMRWIAAAGAIGALGGIGGVGVSPAWGARRRAPSDTIFPWNPLRPGAWVTDGAVQGGNVVVATDGRTVFVIDAKFPYLAPALREDALTLAAAERAAADGPSPALTLINTHHHADHTGGNVAFRESAFASGAVSGVERLAHENAGPRIRDQADRYLQALRNGPATVARLPERERLMPLVLALAERADTLAADDWAPTRSAGQFMRDFGESRAGEVGGTGFRAAHFGPGHTDNDLVITIRALNLMHAGDLIFNGLHPFIDRPAGATTLGWIESLNQMERLCDADTIVVPGHGPVGDRSMIGAMRVYLERLRKAVRADIDAGVSKEEASAKTYEFMQGVGFDQLRPRAIAAVYEELTED